MKKEMNEDIIRGERIQELCDVYCGLPDMFQYNPRILKQKDKHFDLSGLTKRWDNPPLIFCYGDNIRLFMQKRHFLDNPYRLITHNSDENIKEQYSALLDDPKLIVMYSQNVCFDHPKLSLLPIGIANSMWSHGNLDVLRHVMNLSLPKIFDVYFYFNIHTNKEARTSCHDQLVKRGLVFEREMNHVDYLVHLSKHKFAICPEGNGVDSHRIWECYYLGVIPIVHTSVFTQKLRQILPCILLDSWSDFSMAKCLYEYSILCEELQNNRYKLLLPYFSNKFT